MSHGGRWQLVFGEEYEEKLCDFLPKIIEHGNVASTNPEAMGTAIAYMNDDESFGFVALIALKEEGAHEFVSGYPIMPRGIVHPLKVSEVKDEPECLERMVEAEVVGAGSIGFFEPFGMTTDTQYSVDKHYDIELSALAYSLNYAEEQKIPIKKEETIRAMHSDDTLPGGVRPFPLMVSTKGMAACFHRPDLDIGDHEYQGTIKSIETIKFEDQSIYRVVVTVMRRCNFEEDIDDLDEDVDIPIYATEEALEGGYIPRIGDDVNGLMWMQGRAYS